MLNVIPSLRSATTNTEVVPLTDYVDGKTVALEGGAISLEMKGVPKAGDTLSIQWTAFHSGNNGNAMALLDLRDANIVSLDGSSFTTATDAYSQMIGSLGVIVQGGQTSADISQTLQNRSEQTLSSTSGVNLDEEAARLIQFQQSYQAAAKVLQVAQTVFDTLLNISR